MVRVAGLEPVRVAPLEPESSASANSAIPAFGILYYYTIIFPIRQDFFSVFNNLFKIKAQYTKKQTVRKKTR